MLKKALTQSINKGMVCIIVINTKCLATTESVHVSPDCPVLQKGLPLSISAGYMKNAIAESRLRNSASAFEMWYCTVLELMLSVSAISL